MLQLLEMAGADEGARKKESPLEQSKQQNVADKPDSTPSKYRLISREEYDNLMALKASTPVVDGAKSFAFSSASPVRSRSQPGLNETVSFQNFTSTPKLPTFSGSEEPQKGEVTYEVWSFEVKCMRNSKAVPEGILLQIIRNSLKGNARSLLVSLGEQATVSQVLDKLDGFYGLVSTSETLMQEFYNDSQRENESIVQYGSRLESILTKAVKLAHIDNAAKDAMLRSKFWTGLKSKSLRNATRYLFDSIKDFQSLFKEIRKVEQEEMCSSNKPTARKSTTQMNVATAMVEKEPVKQEILDALRNIERRLERVEMLQTQDGGNSYKQSDRSGSSRRGRGKWSKNKNGNPNKTGNQDNKPGNPKEDSFLS